MQLLAPLVAVVSVACLRLAWHAPDLWTTILGALGLVCAFTTWRAQTISSYLKILVGVFSTEVVIFGSIFLIDKLGGWSEAVRTYLPGDSFAVGAAVFSILIYAAFHVPVIRSMTRIADSYFVAPGGTRSRIWPFRSFAAPERQVAAAMLALLVVINQLEVGMLVRLNYFNRDWFNAIQEKNQSEFWYQLFAVWMPWASLYVATYVLEYIIKSNLIIRWRRFLTGQYVARWLDHATHYRMTLGGPNADNPDQRIAEDVNRFLDGGDSGYGIYSFTIQLISNLTTVVSFAVVLWTLSAHYTVPGTNVVVPGFLFWITVIYTLFGTGVAHWIGRSLVGLFFTKQRFEANFRFSLARLREYAEQVALLAGERIERTGVMTKFGDIYSNYLAIIHRQKWIMTFRSFFEQISAVIPYVLSAPFYFAGEITLGIMTQTASAFGRVQEGLNFFVTYYVNLADYKAVVDRLISFDAAMERAHQLGEAAPVLVPAPVNDNALAVEDLALALPDGRRIVAGCTFRLAPDEAVLFSGPSGSGKSTLFRALAGIWPYAKGRVGVPAEARVLLLPQRAYIPIGTLRAALAYPAGPDAYDDAALRDALAAVRLTGYDGQLDTEENWAQRLSGGEQQRVAVARALLARPDWLFLDEATSALDEASEAEIYRAIASRLPDTTVVSIGHRSTLAAFHKRRLEMRPDAAGVFTPVEVTLAAAAE